jgi:anti-anti-sigma factor
VKRVYKRKPHSVTAKIKKAVHFTISKPVLLLMRIFKPAHRHIECCIKEVKELENLVVLRLKGRVDYTTIPTIKANFDRIVPDYIDKNILVDFKDVTRVDSVTLGMIILVLSQLKKRRRTLGIINATPLLENYLKVEKVDAFIRRYPTEEEALQELSQ